MGRGKGRGKGRGGKRQHDGGGDARSVRPRTDAWRTPSDVATNGAFEEYYKEQGVCPPEEWDAMVLSLKKPLPITFRINGRGRFAARLRDKLQTDFMAQFAEGEALMVDGEPAEAPHPLAWYPDKLAWQMNFSRNQLRKLEVLGQLHEFIKRENETGAITRQEAVSMVPPLFLDVQPHHWVLDMCAAPGSKTFQLLEMLHAGPAPATGLVVANDADAMRCNLLGHQTKRMCSPALLITNHEAQGFPVLRNIAPGATEKFVRFDRILCDVPCSGDGTMRKSPDIWRKWSPADGILLHPTQLRITLRACELLRVGGLLVYSTCSLNPMEDEAVVAEVLRRTGAAFELLDVSDQLPGLRRMPGLQRWRVKDLNRWYNNWEEAKQGGNRKLEPTMFPDERSDALPLHRCMRFLPHHQDTGGFFVAVLRKVADLEGTVQGFNEEQRAARKERQQRWQQRQAERQAQAAAGGGDAGDAAAGDAAVLDAGDAGQEANTGSDGVHAPQAAANGEEQEGGQQQAAAGNLKEQQVASAAEAAAKEEIPDAAATAAGATADETVEGGEQPATAVEGDAATVQRQRRAPAPSPPQELPDWGKMVRTGGGRHRGVDPVVPYCDEQQLAAMRDFYGLAPDCPVPNALVARSAEAKPKKLYYVCPAVALLLRLDVREQVKVVSAGAKVLERQDSKDGLVPTVYRFAQDGLPALLPHVNKQRFHPSLDDLITLLKFRNVGLPEGYRVHMTKAGDKEGQAAEQGAAQVADEQATEQPAELQDQVAAKEPTGGAAADVAGAKPDVGGEPVAQLPVQAEASSEHPVQVAGGAPAGAAEQQQEQQNAPRVVLSDPATLEQLRGVAMGCCVALLRPEDAAALGVEAEGDAADNGSLAAASPLAIACWRGRGSINVLVSKQEAAQIVERLQEARAHAAGGKGAE